MQYQGRFYRYSIGVILILVIITLLYHNSYVFTPIFDFIAAVFFPLILAGILYYLLRPIVRFMERHKIERIYGIIISYLVIVFVIVLFGAYGVPTLLEQVGVLTDMSPKTLEQVKEKTQSLVDILPFNISLEELKEIFATYLYQLNAWISNNIASTIATLTHFTLTLVITPFILYYFLKDDRNLFFLTLKTVSPKYRPLVRKIMDDIDTTLSTYITGQMIVSCLLGSLLFMGYLWIGLNSAFILALFSMIAVTIPFLGSFIAIIPALLIGLAQEPFMAVKVIFVMLVAITFESNVISPQVMSHRLHIHPLTVMLLLIASGTLYGVLGLFLATPIYAVVKVILRDLYGYYGDHRDEVNKMVTKVTS